MKHVHCTNVFDSKLELKAGCIAFQCRL